MARNSIKHLWSIIRSEARQKYSRARGKRVIHFLHVNKTGGTAIKHALKPHITTPQYAIVLHGHREALRDVPEGDKVIFCMRDPISRFVSGFYSRLRQGQPRFFVPWTVDEEAAFRHFDTPNVLALALSSADGREKLRAEKAMRSIGHVKDGYQKWLESEDYLQSRISDIFFVGFQERLAQDFELLKSKLGLAQHIQLPTDDVRAHRNPDNIDKRLDPTAFENLENWYAADIRLYNLCRQISESAAVGLSGLETAAIAEHSLPT